MMSIWFRDFVNKRLALPLVVLTSSVFGAAAGAEQNEFSEQTEILVSATAELFETVESVPATNRFQFRIEGVAIPTSTTPAPDVLEAFPAEYGPVAHLTGYRINWYPVDRLLGAVDFMGTYDRNRGLVCGYVTWDLSNPEDPQVDQLVANYVDLKLLSKRHPGATHAALLDANCAFGAIEPNYAVFEPAG